MSHRSRKNPPQGGFFRLQAADYAQQKRISRRSFDLFYLVSIPVNLEEEDGATVPP